MASQFFSEKIEETYGYRKAPALANAKIYCNGEECGALLYRSEEEPSPGDLPLNNRWRYIFSEYNKTAMIGNPSDFRIPGNDKYFWAEKTGYISVSSTFSTNGYSPGEGYSGMSWRFCPPRVGDAGIMRYQKTTGSTTDYIYCVFINGRMVYQTYDGCCPILLTMPFGYALITFSRVRYRGYYTTLAYVDSIISFTPYGSSKAGWTYYINGEYELGLYNNYAKQAGSISSVAVYDDNFNYITTYNDFSRNLAYSTVPACPTQSVALLVYSDPEFSIGTRTTSGVIPGFSISKYGGELKFSWCPYVALHGSVLENAVKTLGNWSSENPLVKSSTIYSGDICRDYNPFSNSGCLGAVLLYPTNTGSKDEYYSFSNWGVYIGREYSAGTEYYLKSYQNQTVFWRVKVATSYDGTLLGWYVSVSYDAFNHRDDSATIYLIFSKTTGSGSYHYMKKCTLDRLDHIYQLNSSNITIEDVPLGVYNFNYPLVSGNYYFTMGDDIPPNIAVDEQWASIFRGASFTSESLQVYIDGSPRIPFGSNYTIFNPFSSAQFYRKTASGNYGAGDIYDLDPILINLDDIQGSLDYIMTGEREEEW